MFESFELLSFAHGTYRKFLRVSGCRKRLQSADTRKQLCYETLSLNRAALRRGLWSLSKASQAMPDRIQERSVLGGQFFPTAVTAKQRELHFKFCCSGFQHKSMLSCHGDSGFHFLPALSLCSLLPPSHLHARPHVDSSSSRSL